MPDLAAVLFDVDETLYDRRAAQGLILRHLAARLPDLFEGCAFEAMAAAFAESDRQTAEHFMTTASIGASRDARSRIFLEELGRPAARAREVSEAYVAAYRRTAAPVPGAVETVARCARHLPVGVVSNAFPDVQYDKLRAIGLEGAFQCVLLSEEVGVRKPDPRIFHQACAALGAEPGRVVYVGDSYRNDVVGARNAGLLSCWYNPGGAAPEDPQVRPEYQIQALDQLPGALGLRA